MVLETYSCPECRTRLRAGSPLNVGDLVKCPRCSAEFHLPEAGSPSLVPTSEITEKPILPQPPVPPVHRSWDRDESDGWPRRGASPGRNTGLTGQGGRPLSSCPGEYTVDLGLWFRLAARHWSVLLGGTIGWGVLCFVIVVMLRFVPCFGPIIALIIAPVLEAGITVVALAQLKGTPWTFENFFDGFWYLGALWVNRFLTGLFLFLTMSPAIVLFILMEESGDESLLPLALLAFILCSCLACYILLRCFLFSSHLILDRNLDGGRAFGWSWVLTRGHFWDLLGVCVLLGLINLAGMLLFVVGVLFTLPLTSLVLTAGYLIIGGTCPPVGLEQRPAED